MNSGERYYELSLLGRDTFLETFANAALICSPIQPNKNTEQTLDKIETGEFIESDMGDPKSWAMHWKPARYEIFPLAKLAGTHFVDLVTLGRTISNDIRIDHFSVSRSHLFFRQRDEKWFVCDAGSKNGTRVNGTFLKPRTEHELTDHAMLMVGGVEMRYCSANALFELLSEY